MCAAPKGNEFWKQRKLSELKEYQNNSRTHSQEQIKQIEISIKEFGPTNPIIIDENNMILAGHCRKLAAINCELEEFPEEVDRNLLVEDVLVWDGCQVHIDYVEPEVDKGTYYWANGSETTHYMPLPKPPEKDCES